MCGNTYNTYARLHVGRYADVVKDRRVFAVVVRDFIKL